MRVRFIAIISAVLIANAIFFLYFGFFRRSSEQHFVYGETFPDRSAVDFNGRPLDWKNKWALLIYSTLEFEEGVRNARYAEVVFRRFESSGLVVAAILRGGKSEIATFVESNGLSYPVVMDRDGSFASRLSLGEHPFGIFIVDPKGRIEFTATHAEPEDLRQLSEKYLLGTISYPRAGGRDALKVGENIPPMRLQDLRQGQQVNLVVSSERAVVIFTARCPSCGLKEYLTSYRMFEVQRKKGAEWPLVIFSSRFSAREIREMASELDISARLYLANDAIPGVEDEYYSGSYGSNEALVVTTDTTGTVTGIESLAKALRKTKGETPQ